LILGFVDDIVTRVERVSDKVQIAVRVK